MYIYIYIETLLQCAHRYSTEVASHENPLVSAGLECGVAPGRNTGLR